MNYRKTKGVKSDIIESTEEKGYNHNHDPRDRRFTSVTNSTFGIDNLEESDIIKLEVGKSLSAGAKNYPVKLPDSNQHVKLSEDQTVSGTAFAGKGTSTEIKDRFRLESTYGIAADKWEKVSGKGKVIIGNKTREAELHWYQADGEIVEMKVKRYLDEN